MADHWNACVESILGMLEDILVRQGKTGPIPTKQASRKPSRCPHYSAPLWKRSITSNQPHKRKRQLGVDIRDRKIIRTSSTGSSNMYRGTGRSFDNLTTTTATMATMTSTASIPSSLYSSNENHLSQPLPIKKQEHFNLSNSTKSRLDQWLLLQTQHTNILSLSNATLLANTAERDGDDNNHCYTKQLVLEIKNIANRLLSTTLNTDTHLYFRNLKNDLVQFSILIRKWLSLDANNKIPTLFPNWTSLEDCIYGMMGYIKGHELMPQFDMIPRTDDLLYDIHYMQSILDDGADFIGTELVTNGSTWKEMGWWVDQDILDTTKQQLSNLCIGLQHELSSELAKLGCTEKMMECMVCGLELMASATELTGCSLDLGHDDFYKPLVILYAQWTNDEIQHTARQSRSDLRRLQLLNNMTRVLSAFHSLANRNNFILTDIQSMDSLASLLVDITINVVSKIDQQLLNQNQSYIQRSNIMRNTFLPILYLEQSLVAFADGIVTLTDQNIPSQTKRIKWLYNLLE